MKQTPPLKKTPTPPENVTTYTEREPTEKEKEHPNPGLAETDINETGLLPVIDQHDPPGTTKGPFVEPGNSIGGGTM